MSTQRARTARAPGPGVIPAEPLAGEAMRFEVAERLNWQGEAVTPLTDAEAERAAAEVVASGADAVAICFLFAYLNPAHERKLADAIRAKAPDMRISLASDVQPEFREYERFQTTAINAYLQPLTAGYVERLAAGLKDTVGAATLGVNQSSGGLMSPERTASYPVRTALSGPAAGAPAGCCSRSPSLCPRRPHRQTTVARRPGVTAPSLDQPRLRPAAHECTRRNTQDRTAAIAYRDL